MPWYNGNYPSSYKNQPLRLRQKATEIANELLLNGADEGVAIATGLKKAREHFAWMLNEASAKPSERSHPPAG
jgi:uncharacterized protein YdaT